MDLSSLAIQASLSRDWKEAIKLNLQILKEQPNDVDALNRLGKAYLQHGDKAKSELTYKKVLKIDKFNPIAQKNLLTIKTFKIEPGVIGHATSASNYSQAFLEEPGTTKSVNLIRLSDSKTLAYLQPGDEVFLVAHEHCVSVVDARQEYLGRLPDDLASRLRPFLKAGNRYQVWIKSLDILDKPQDKQNMKIFIKEISRVGKFRNTPSFPSTEKLTYAAFTPPELIHNEKPNISTPEEDVDGFSNMEGKIDTEDSDAIPLPDDD